MQYVNSSSLSPTIPMPPAPDTTRVVVTADTTQEPYCFLREGTLHSDADTHIQGLSDSRANDQDRLHHFCSLRDLADPKHRHQFELKLEVDRSHVNGQWSYAFLLNQNPIYTSEQQRIGDGRDVAIFETEQLRQNFCDPLDFEKISVPLQGFQHRVRETSDQVSILAAFQNFKNQIPQSYINKLEIHVEQLPGTSGSSELHRNEGVTYRFDIRADRGVTTMYRSAPVENAKNIVAYASYFGAYKQLAQELNKLGRVVLGNPGITPFLEEAERPFLDISSDTDLDIIQAKAFETISNLAIPFGVNISIDFVDSDKFQLQMEGKVFHEGSINGGPAHNDPFNPSSRYQITHSALMLSRLQITLAHKAIRENFAAYRLCDVDGLELSGPTLQEALQDQNGKGLKIEARRVMNPLQATPSCSYSLILHSEHSSRPRFFSIPKSGTVASGQADASQSETLLKALCADAKQRIYDASVPLMDAFNASLFRKTMGEIILTEPPRLTFLEAFGISSPIVPVPMPSIKPSTPAQAGRQIPNQSTALPSSSLDRRDQRM